MRNSNIELLRIVAMLAVIAHHYVINSTVMLKFNLVQPTANSIFLQCWGMWGKSAINIFVLITGFFMCESRLTLRRYLKLLFEIVFYSWTMWLVLAFLGYEALSWGGALRRLFCYNILSGQNSGFTPAFMWMYLMIPFMNVYVRAASRRNMLACVAVLLALFVGCGTILKANVYHHVFWYVTLYFVGAAIRKHHFAWMNANHICVPALIVSVIAAYASVLGVDFIQMKLGRSIGSPYFLVMDSHRLLAFVVALFAFLAFKNWRIPQSRLINTIASTTFGVLLIHAATDGMRKWLWQDFVNVPAAYYLSFPCLIGYSVLVMFCVFGGCAVFDYMRIRFIENPLFGMVEKYFKRERSVPKNKSTIIVK